MIRRICIFGDSIAFGSNDFEFGGWQNHLKVYFAKTGDFCHVFNLAISGRTSNDITQRFKTELLARKSSSADRKVLALIAIPVNDTRYTKTSKNTFEITQEHFKENLKRLKELSNEYADKTVFVGMTCVDDSKTNPLRLAGGETYWENKVIKKYNDIARDFCEREHLLFIDMIDVLNKDDLEDGLHPNTEGHRKMFECIKEFLVDHKLIN